MEGYGHAFDKVLLSDLMSIHFPRDWGALATFCRKSEFKDMYQLMFMFAVMSFRDGVDMNVLRTLVAFAVLGDLKILDPPKWPSYKGFRPEQIPTADYLVQYMKPFCVPYPGDLRSTFHLSLSAKQRRVFEAAERAHEQQVEHDCQALAYHLLEQWPCPEPTIEAFAASEMVHAGEALGLIRPEWLRLSQNLELSDHIQAVQRVLDDHRAMGKTELPELHNKDQKLLRTRCREGQFPSLSRQLLRKIGPIKSNQLNPKPPNRESTHTATPNHQSITSSRDKENHPGGSRQSYQPESNIPSDSGEMQELDSIIRDITNSPSTLQQQYGQDMMQSLDALRVLKAVPDWEDGPVHRRKFAAELPAMQSLVRGCFDQLCKALQSDDSRAQWLKEGGLWPCITPVTLLEQLRSTSNAVFGSNMKESLIAYAVAITHLQRHLRIENARRKADNQKFDDERKNPGHVNWRPLEYPDWLLLEIDADILIRQDQVDVALATISPASGANSVLQMNMGQGESVIDLESLRTELERGG